MRLFVTGATGFIGSAVVQNLLAAGHQVLGLARTQSAAAALTAAGAQVHHGSLEDLDSLRQGAAAADGVIHTAFIHDFSKFQENCEIDRRAIDALGNALSGSKRPLVITSGSALVSQGSPANEDTPPITGPNAVPRIASEEAAAALADRGIHISIVRLPPSVHGQGDHAFVPQLIQIARQKGVAAYIGDGQNRWPAVHRLDAAQLFRLAVEKGAAYGKYHGIHDQGIATRDIAATIGRHLKLPVVSVSPQEAVDHFGFLGHFFGRDCPATSTQTQAQLGWQPQQPGLLADLDQGHYFQA